MEPPQIDPPIYTGEFRHAMDAKNRVTIPSRWRKGDVDEYFSIAKPEGGCLIVMPTFEFRRQVEKVERDESVLPADRRRFIRQFSSRAQHLTGDKQGRIVLPDEQCRQLHLQGDVFLIGAYSRFEIWSPALWQQTSSQEESTYATLFNKFGP